MTKYIVVIDHPELGLYHEVFTSKAGAIKLANNNGFALIVEVGGDVTWTNLLGPHDIDQSMYGSLESDELPLVMPHSEKGAAEEEPYDAWWDVLEDAEVVQWGDGPTAAELDHYDRVCKGELGVQVEQTGRWAPATLIPITRLTDGPEDEAGDVEIAVHRGYVPF